MSYQQLQQDIADWLVWPDLNPYIPTFIRMAESRFNRVLRTKEMISRAKAVTENQYVPLPADWLMAKNVQRQTDGKALSYMTLEELDAYRFKITQGDIHPQGPEHYTFVGDTLELAPSPTEESPVTIEMAYYRKIPALSDDIVFSSNWLLAEHYDVYLYGSLIHSAPFLKEDARIPVWKELADAALMELNLAEASARTSGSTLKLGINNELG